MLRLTLVLVMSTACSKLIDLADVTYDGGTPACSGVTCSPAPSCSDGQKNGSETDVDCGGACAPCATGNACVSGQDCATGSCQAMACQPAGCTDGVKNGDETDVDCGGACVPCAPGSACGIDPDCSSGVCASSVCQAARCTDGVKNGDETDVDCGGACQACSAGQACAVDPDCAGAGICDSSRCRVARSCAEILGHLPGSGDGVYRIAPPGVAVAFSVVCDMTRDGGGWTLLLKAQGDGTLGYSASAWTDTSLLNPDDLTTQPGNAKYPSFVALPITTLRGELDGFRYTQSFAGVTALDIFGLPAAVVAGYPTFNTGAPNWSTQPNCQTFGVNTPFGFARARFGWSANQENDCDTNDTAIGLGLMNSGTDQRGAGYECLSTLCSAGNVDTGGNGLLWAR